MLGNKESITSLVVASSVKLLLKHITGRWGWKGAGPLYVTVLPRNIGQGKGEYPGHSRITVSLLNLIPEAILFILYYCYLQSWKSTRGT